MFAADVGLGSPELDGRCVFIQGGVVGALTWIRLESVEVQGRRSKAGTRFGRTYKAGARDYSSSFFLETTRDYWFDGVMASCQI